SRCVKCGFTCDVQNVDYRYRLSLKVSRGRNIFDVTIFGGCLNSFFGITAADLQRFVDSGKPEGAHNLHQLLTKAVEDCFIGKTFVFGFKLSGLEAEGCLLDESLGFNAETAQFVACQIISPNEAFLGMTVFTYLQSLLQVNSHPSCSTSKEAVCQSQQIDSLVNSFEYTLPLCGRSYPEACGVRLTQLWQETTGMDSCFSPDETSGHLLQQITVDDVRYIASENVHSPWPKLDPGSELSLLFSSQVGQVINADHVHYATDTISNSKHVESKSGTHNRPSNFSKFSSTFSVVDNELDFPVARTSSVTHESFDPMNSKVFHRWPVRELADTQYNTSFSGKMDFSHYTEEALEDAPLSESLGSFISTDPHISKPVTLYDLKPASTCKTPREPATPIKNNCALTPLHNITNVITNCNKATLNKKHQKRKTLSLSKTGLPGTPRVPQVPEDRHIKDIISNSFTKNTVSRVFSVHRDQREKDVAQADHVVRSQIQNAKGQETPSGSSQDEYNCSADLFYQSSSDTNIPDLTDKAVSDHREIKKDWLLDLNGSEQEVSMPIHFAPSLQSTPVARSYYRRSYGPTHVISRKWSGSPCTKKRSTHVTSFRILGNHSGITQGSKAIKPEPDQIQSSDFISQNSDFDSETFGRSAHASEVRRDEEHDSALPTDTNEWSRDLFF
ncbi:hypothetical protein NFI96_017406, partial [Prochilodus magdalenae]